MTTTAATLSALTDALPLAVRYAKRHAADQEISARINDRLEVAKAAIATGRGVPEASRLILNDVAGGCGPRTDRDWDKWYALQEAAYTR